MELSDIIKGNVPEYRKYEDRFDHLLKNKIEYDSLDKINEDIAFLKYNSRKGNLGRALKDTSRDIKDKTVDKYINKLQKYRNKEFYKNVKKKADDDVKEMINIYDLNSEKNIYGLKERLETIKTMIVKHGEYDMVNPNNVDELNYLKKRIEKNNYLNKKAEKDPSLNHLRYEIIEHIEGYDCINETFSQKKDKKRTLKNFANKAASYMAGLFG
ncbi:MAG: hypothetical protein ACQEP1_03330 [Nanobdellota archaeon]